MLSEEIAAMERDLSDAPSIISLEHFNLWYDDFQALKDISLEIPRNKVTAFIGPSGCGKSTLLRTFNRMCDFVPSVKTEGTLLMGGRNIFSMDSNELRVLVGMVFQHPNPFPMSIRDNILYGPRRMGRLSRADADEIVERSLRDAGLWDEVKDKLGQSGQGISGGQQQRLCIARTLALNPDVILFDEPCSALDPISTLAIEDLMSSIVADRAIVIVTHNMEQASRVSNRTAFFYMGDMVEYDETDEIFQRPKDKRLNDYLTGMFS